MRQVVFVSARAQLPVLANIKLTAKGAKLFVEATNLEVSYSSSIGATVSEEGEVAVPARFMTELVNSLSGEKCEISVEGESVNVLSDQSESVVSGMNAQDFPQVPGEIDGGGVAIESGEFVKALGQVLFSTSLDDTRPALSGVLFVFGNRTLTLVSSDGFRLSRKKFEFSGEENDTRLILPKSVLNELVKLAGNVDKIQFHYSEKDNQVLIGLGSSVLGSRVIEGDYPNFEKIIPNSFNTEVEVDKREFQSAVKRASLFARDGANTILVEVGEKELSVSAKASKHGTQDTKLDASIKGKEQSVLFNYRYLEDFLSVCNSENLVLKFIDENSSGVFQDTSEPQYLHIIMPVKS